MFAAALFVLSAFPLELDGGFGVPVEGRAPRVVVANERPHVVWLDPRRQWLDRRNGEAIFTVELPLDGGSAASPGTSLADTAPASREGFSVAGGGSKDFLLVVWEEPSSPTRWNRRVALRLPSGSVETSFGPTGAPALPVAAGWAGEAGLAAWREADGGPIVSQWVRASLGTLPGVSLGLNTTALALGSAGDGGSMWVASVEDGGVSTRRVPLLSTASSSVPPSGAGTHIALDSRGLVLLIQNGPTTRLLPLVTGDSSFVDGGVPLTGRPSVDVTSSGRIFVGLPTGAGGQLWLEQDGGDVPLTIPGPSLSLATIREFAFIAAETPRGSSRSGRRRQRLARCG